MPGDQYIEEVLKKHEHKPGVWAAVAIGAIVPELRKWAGINLNRICYTGSVAKGTAISGTTDLDIFVSLKHETPHTLEDVYERLFARAQEQKWAPKRQNVSIGLNYLGVEIDLVPGKVQQGYTYYHSLWRNRAGTWTQSAPEIHIDKVKDSGRTREIRAIKIWRKNHGLEFPSFYLELAVMRALSGCGQNLANNVQRALAYIADNIGTAAFEDPSNTANMISGDLTAAEKKTIAEQARRSHDENLWPHTLW